MPIMSLMVMQGQSNTRHERCPTHSGCSSFGMVAICAETARLPVWGK